MHYYYYFILFFSGNKVRPQRGLLPTRALAQGLIPMGSPGSVAGTPSHRPRTDISAVPRAQHIQSGLNGQLHRPLPPGGRGRAYSIRIRQLFWCLKFHHSSPFLLGLVSLRPVSLGFSVSFSIFIFMLCR